MQFVIGCCFHSSEHALLDRCRIGYDTSPLHFPTSFQPSRGPGRMSDVVQKFWGFCHTLRHDGIDYGDYIEQITYLLFLKMADERGIDLSRMAVAQDQGAPIDCSWPALASAQGEPLTRHYNGVLRTLGKQPGLLGDIFTGAASRFNNPANLKRLIDLIDETKWTTM